MTLKNLAEVGWVLYQDGKPQANNQKLAEADIMQMCKMSAANNFRQQYLFGQKVIPGKNLLETTDDPEYYFVSPLLSIKRFALPETDNAQGMRRADMNEFDLYRLPKNAHFTGLYLVNNECGGQKVGNLTLVKNGEEKFYLWSKFRSFIFGVVVGRGVNTFNVPPCVKNIDIETTYDSELSDISLDVCYDVLTEVLSMIFKIEDATGEMQIKMREELKKREDIK